MALAPGTRLGPYEIVAPLGAGGMADGVRVVYDGNFEEVSARAADPAPARRTAGGCSTRGVR